MTQCHVRTLGSMPDCQERAESFDADEEVIWDFDNAYPLDEGDDE